MWATYKYTQHSNVRFQKSIISFKQTQPAGSTDNALMQRYATADLLMSLIHRVA